MKTKLIYEGQIVGIITDLIERQMQEEIYNSGLSEAPQVIGQRMYGYSLIIGKSEDWVREWLDERNKKLESQTGKYKIKNKDAIEKDNMKQIVSYVIMKQIEDDTCNLMNEELSPRMQGYAEIIENCEEFIDKYQENTNENELE